MAILRDIAARLGLDLDKRSFKEADDSLDGLTDRFDALRSTAQVAVLAGVGVAAGRAIGLASDAQETLNVLDASFQDNQQAVLEWASTFANEAGRSEFQLREMAGTLGAVLNPLMEKNAEAAAEMSTQLSALAVDLGSFFNATDQEALEALRSGIVGESEPLKRFGIVMQDATLEAFRLSQGITKSFKSMTIAEKTALRYQFILDQTQLAQGDAAKTSEGWANASKALVASLKDLGTRIGLTMLPFAEKLLRVTRNIVAGFTEWVKGTNFIKAALIVLGAIVAKVALGILISMAPILLPFIKFAAIVAVAALVLDDFLTFMEGGKSVIGEFIDAIFGPGSAANAADNLKLAWEGVVLFWKQEVIPGLRVLKSWFIDVAGDIRDAWNRLFESFGDWIIENQRALLKFADTVKKGLASVASFLGINISSDGAPPRTRGRGTSAPLVGERSSVPAATLPPRESAAPNQSSTTINQSTTVQVMGNASASDAGKIADTAASAQRKLNRQTRAALTQEAD